MSGFWYSSPSFFQKRRPRRSPVPLEVLFVADLAGVGFSPAGRHRLLAVRRGNGGGGGSRCAFGAVGAAAGRCRRGALSRLPAPVALPVPCLFAAMSTAERVRFDDPQGRLRPQLAAQQPHRLQVRVDVVGAAADEPGDQDARERRHVHLRLDRRFDRNLVEVGAGGRRTAQRLATSCGVLRPVIDFFEQIAVLLDHGSSDPAPPPSRRPCARPRNYPAARRRSRGCSRPPRRWDRSRPLAASDTALPSRGQFCATLMPKSTCSLACDRSPRGRNAGAKTRARNRPTARKNMAGSSTIATVPDGPQGLSRRPAGRASNARTGQAFRRSAGSRLAGVTRFVTALTLSVTARRAAPRHRPPIIRTEGSGCPSRSRWPPPSAFRGRRPRRWRGDHGPADRRRRLPAPRLPGEGRLGIPCRSGDTGQKTRVPGLAQICLRARRSADGDSTLHPVPSAGAALLADAARPRNRAAARFDPRFPVLLDLHPATRRRCCGFAVMLDPLAGRWSPSSARAPRRDTPARLASGSAAELAEPGIVVASGLARGVDSAAHQGCSSAGGATVAVLGSGLDRVYPLEHAPSRVAESASTARLVSELAPGAPPLPEHFPLRNRIISGSPSPLSSSKPRTAAAP